MRKLMTGYQLFGTIFCDQIISGEYHRWEDELLGPRKLEAFSGRAHIGPII